MSGLGPRRSLWLALTTLRHWLVPAVVATALASGCEYPFQSIQENENAIFSMFGYLDLKADTQWVRVMPVRQNLLLGPEPIDALVTLEHPGSGRIVTMRDSLFAFTDRQLDGVAYAYNFWSTEPLEPGEAYRIRAVRSDGASTTATVVMPPDVQIAYRSGPGFGSDNALFQVQAEHVLFVEVFHAMSDAAGNPVTSIVIRQDRSIPTDDASMHSISIRGDSLVRDGLRDVRRREIRVAVARAGWPYHAGLPDIAVALPGTVPSNVENGVGFVGGVATWTIPFHRCEVLTTRPTGEEYCTTIFNAQSATIAGSVIREPCGDPHVLGVIRLTERYAGGGAVIRTWKTGWDGRYRFEGVEPGADLVLDLGPGTPAVQLPRLGPGQRHFVEDISVPTGC